MPKAKHDLFWRCQVCSLGGAAKGTPNTRVDKAIQSMLDHHTELTGDAGIKCRANFLAVPQGDRDYWLLCMKDENNVDLFNSDKPVSIGWIVGKKDTPERCTSHRSFNGCELEEGHTGKHKSGGLEWEDK